MTGLLGKVPYINHARRHLPTGSDPLPFGVLPWAVLYGGFAQKAYASPGSDRVPFDSSAIHHDTAGAFSVAGGSQAKELTISLAGLYEIDIMTAWEAWPITTPVKLRLVGVPSTDAGDDLYDFQTTVVDDDDAGIMRLHVLQHFTNLPFTLDPVAEQSSGVDQWLDGIYMKVVQLSAD